MRQLNKLDRAKRRQLFGLRTWVGEPDVRGSTATVASGALWPLRLLRTSIACGRVSAHKKSRSRSPCLKKAKVPDWLSGESASQPRPLSKHELDDLALDVQRGIQDTLAWKDLVRRFGKSEAERILKLALYSRHDVDGSQDN